MNRIDRMCPINYPILAEFNINQHLRKMMIGFAEFREDVDFEMYHCNRKLFSNLQWNIQIVESIQEKRYIHPQIIKKIDRSYAADLIVCDKYNSLILKSIAHCEFYSLRRLNLSGNLIESIEAISFLNCPQLQKLFLNDNYIMNFRSLRKFQGNYLYELNLSENNYTNELSLKECNMPSLNTIDLQLNQTVLQMYHICTFLQSNQIRQINFLDYGRYSSERKKRMLVQKMGRTISNPYNQKQLAYWGQNYD